MAWRIGRTRRAGPPASVSPRCTPAYLQWLGAERAHAASREAHRARELAARPGAPRFSLLVPLFETDPAMLSAMLDSVFAQTWPHWELCLCDDASARTDTAQALATRISARLAEHDSGFEPGRVRLVRHATNTGIVGTSNDALALAGGDWIVLLDHDDTLAPHALAALAQALEREPDARLLYSDEDKLDESGLRCLPYFKPDFSPALLATQNYIGHLLALRADLMQALGGFREGTDGSQDYDLVLRASEATRAIVHVPQVLYHWRLHAGSTAINTDSKPYAHEAGRLALAEHLAAALSRSLRARRRRRAPVHLPAALQAAGALPGLDHHPDQGQGRSARGLPAQHPDPEHLAGLRGADPGQQLHRAGHLRVVRAHPARRLPACGCCRPRCPSTGRA
jgi:GT2 family glycosyltransferase